MTAERPSGAPFVPSSGNPSDPAPRDARSAAWSLTPGTSPVIVIGGGMAGVEAARVLSAAGVPVRLYEMRPVRRTNAHRTADLAEVVCSNSLGSTVTSTGKGLLLAEMAALGSLVVAAAQRNGVPAGASLAVDRDAFAADVTARVAELPGVEVIRGEVTTLPEPLADGTTPAVLIATGPLTSDALAAEIARVVSPPTPPRATDAPPSEPPRPSGPFSGDAPRASSAATALTEPLSTQLYFYDAIAPIVTAESIDRSLVFEASRYDRGAPDFLNCPLDEAQYEAFIDALLAGEVVPTHDFEDARHFEGCMPIEELASRGRRTLAFGPMKPVGLVDPRTGRRPFAVVQLRREDRAGRLYNLVGFQTKLRYPEQKRIFALIPGLEQAEFVRLGSLHRNTFVNAPALLGEDLSLRARPSVWLAGQITGVEGYAESAACGIMAALAIVARLRGEAWVPPPEDTMIGGLLAWMRHADPAQFQPMNSNFGLLPELPKPARGKRGKREKKALMAERALASLEAWRRACGLGWLGEAVPIAAAQETEPTPE